VVHLVEKAEEGFLGVAQGGGLEVLEDAFDERWIAEEFRRDRGVGVGSKGAVIAFGSVGGDEFAKARGERGFFAENFLREAGEVIGGGGLEGEEVPDLRVLLALALHGFNGGEVG
jgi:hypothetical protein